MARKYKYFLLSILVLLGTIALSPSVALARPAPLDDGSKNNTSSGSTENCAATGTCADCSAASSAASGCIDCSVNGSACKDSATNKTCDNNRCDLVGRIVNPLIVLLSGLVGLAVALSIIVGSIQYASSAGDPQKAAKGRDRIKNAIIALIAYIFLFAFLNFIIPGGLLRVN